MIPTAVVVALVAGAPAALAGAPADESVESAALIVDVRAESSAGDWFAAAIEETIEHELVGHRRLRLIDERDLAPLTCEADDASCIVAGFGGAGADIVLLGQVRGDAVHYHLYETRTPARLSTGSISVARGTSLIDLGQQTMRALRPVLTHGGLLDQLPYLHDTRVAAQTATAARPGQPDVAFALILAAAIVALLLALPLLVTGFALRQPFSELVRLRSTWIAAALIAACAGIAAFAATSSAVTAPSLSNLRYRWLLGLAGGLAWTALALDAAQYAFPALRGIERVGHRNVFRLIRAWVMACVQRVVAVALYYAPVALVVIAASASAGLPADLTWIIVAPACGLLARFWLSSWVDCLALYVDEHMVHGQASGDNPWHQEIHRYFMGYVRRSGWNIDSRVLESIVFLPGTCEGVVSYGGGLTPTRIVVNEHLLRRAMGALEDVAAAEIAVELPDWNAGLVTAQDPDSPSQRKGKRPPRLAGPRATTLMRYLRLHVHAEPRRPIGQAATLLGYAVPERSDELTPLIADDIRDLEVVRELLNEHFDWAAPDPDEENDDTNPRDLDLLFGGLARAVGAVERRDDRGATLGQACRLATRNAPTALRTAIELPGELRYRLFSRYPAMVADAYAAVHHGRDHLVQYLYFVATQSDRQLTARATPGQLSRASSRILSTVEDWPARRRDALLTCASPRNRLVWLSKFYAEPIGDRQERWARRALVGAAVAGVLLTTGTAVKRAIDYHPIYIDRIAEQERKLLSEQESASHEQSQEHPRTIERE